MVDHADGKRVCASHHLIHNLPLMKDVPSGAAPPAARARGDCGIRAVPPRCWASASNIQCCSGSTIGKNAAATVLNALSDKRHFGITPTEIEASNHA